MLTSIIIIYIITVLGYFLIIQPEFENRHPLEILMKSLWDVSAMFLIIAGVYALTVSLMILIR
jgi:hypothetical protein